MSAKVLLPLLALALVAIENSLGQNNGRGDPKRNFLIFPGTKWCGKGSIAKSYHDLGKYKRTDKCCRTHDKHCRARIQPFRKKYGLWNLSWKVASHCDCEIVFNKCLRKVNSHVSRALRDLYFKGIEPRCFRFKYVKKCVKRSWWRCKKEKRVRIAKFYSLKRAIG